MIEPPAFSPPDASGAGTAASDPGYGGADDGARTSTPLGRSLGLSDGDVGILGRLFGDLTASLGIDGEPIFERLAQGQSIGQALAMPPGTVERVYARAHAWFALGRIERAEPLFRALCLLSEEDADFWVGYGVCLRMTGQPAKARQAFEAAANLRPDWALPHFHALELAVLQRHWPQALAALAAYDARAGADIPPPVAAEAARLRLALERGIADGGGAGGDAVKQDQPDPGARPAAHAT